MDCGLSPGDGRVCLVHPRWTEGDCVGCLGKALPANRTRFGLFRRTRSVVDAAMRLKVHRSPGRAGCPASSPL